MQRGQARLRFGLVTGGSTSNDRERERERERAALRITNTSF